MTSLADRILVGPRGRRLCLELAMGDDVVRETVFWAMPHDHGGMSWVPLTPGVQPPAPADLPRRTVADVVAGIRDADVVVDASAIDEALGRAVDSARYWQEPDGEDVLAAEPRVREALAPIAARVAASDHWLHTGRADATWLVAWDETPPRPPIDLAATRAAELASDECMRAHELDHGGVPMSGEWWSTPQTPETVGRLPIALGLVEDELGWRGATATRVAEPRRLLRIATLEDWVALCRAHPLELTFARRHDWTRATGERHRWVVPDWAAVAERHDAVHLDVRCWLEGAGRALAIDAERATVIAGWSPDATCWLAPPTPTDADRPRRFVRDGGDAWMESDPVG